MDSKLPDPISIEYIIPGYFDTLIYGSTPGGMAAALSSAREGDRTVLVSPTKHVGEMSASGLCTTDAVRRDAFGGICSNLSRSFTITIARPTGRKAKAYRLAMARHGIAVGGGPSSLRKAFVAILPHCAFPSQAS